METIAAANSKNSIPKNSSGARTLARRTASFLGRILALLIAFLLGLPVILLPLTTSVPAWVWILLAIADVVLIILQFRFALDSRGTLGVLAGILLVSLIAVAASQFFAATPPIVDSNGQPIPGSIGSPL